MGDLIDSIKMAAEARHQMLAKSSQVLMTPAGMTISVPCEVKQVQVEPRMIKCKRLNGQPVWLNPAFIESMQVQEGAYSKDAYLLVYCIGRDNGNYMLDMTPEELLAKIRGDADEC